MSTGPRKIVQIWLHDRLKFDIFVVQDYLDLIRQNIIKEKKKDDGKKSHIE